MAVRRTNAAIGAGCSGTFLIARHHIVTRPGPDPPAPEASTSGPRLARLSPPMPIRPVARRSPARRWDARGTMDRPLDAILPRAAHPGATPVDASTAIRRCLVLLLLALGAAPARATAAAPPPCPGVRFLLPSAFVPGSGLAVDAIVVDGDGMATIASGCPPVRARVRRHRGRSTIRARWTACGSLRSVRMIGTVDGSSCAALAGMLGARATGLQRFEAPRSACGDGRLDAAGSEQCETAADCADGQPCDACQCGGASGSITTAARKKTTTTTSTTKPAATSTSSSTSTSTSSSATNSSSTTSSSTSTSRSSTTTTSGSTTTTTVPGQLFTAANPWNTDVSTLPKSATSDGIIQALAAAGGWGYGSMRIDFSIEVLQADASTPFLTFTPTSDFYSPDCDHVPFPVPPGALEGETGYQCVSNGDCHLIVVHRPTNTL